MPVGFVKSGDQGFMFVLHEIDEKTPAKNQKKRHLYDTIMPAAVTKCNKRNKNIWGLSLLSLSWYSCRGREQLGPQNI